MLKKMITLTIIITFLLTFLQNCDTTEPPSNKTISLTFEDASSTEVWLKLRTENISLPQQVSLLQNDTLRYSISLTTNDTTLYIDSLLPSQTYKFQTIIQSTNHKSNNVSVTTMDTTSHNFTWETFTFGEQGSSSIYDITIIDENNIWAVGEIYINDSLGHAEPRLYNAVHWNGIKWELKKISILFRGNTIIPSLEGAFAFSKEDIWFVGSLPIYGDGENWEMYDLRTIVDENLSLSKTWGSDSQNVYFVGRGGSIAHYNGENWTKIKSGTQTLITDIWGITNPNTLESEVYCAVSNFFIVPGENDKKILRIKNENIIEELLWDTNRNVSTVWTNNGIVLYAGGDGLFENRNNKWNEIHLGVNYYSNKIRGTGLNNLFVVGGFGLVAHYNGISWKVYDELQLNNGNYVSIFVMNNIVSIVGSEGNKAQIVIGTQN